jgi:hypothetical protein
VAWTSSSGSLVLTRKGQLIAASNVHHVTGSGSYCSFTPTPRIISNCTCDNKNNRLLKRASTIFLTKWRIACKSEWASDCCSTPTRQFFSYIMTWTS